VCMCVGGTVKCTHPLPHLPIHTATVLTKHQYNKMMQINSPHLEQFFFSSSSHIHTVQHTLQLHFCQLCQLFPPQLHMNKVTTRLRSMSEQTCQLSQHCRAALYSACYTL